MAQAPEHSALVARRLVGFKVHLLAYAAAMAVLVVVHLMVQPEQPWVVLPLVAWGAPLAVHCAYVLGLFGGRNG